MKSQKVALVSLPQDNTEENLCKQKEKVNIDSRMGVEHVGLLYLEELLDNAGIDTQTHDFAFDVYHCSQTRELDEYIKTILRHNPSVVGFSPYYTSINGTLYAADGIKRRSPKTKVILGGSHATHTADEILRDNQCIDAIFLGEAFGSIVPGVQKLLNDGLPEDLPGISFRKGKEIVNTGWGSKLELDSIPFPRRSRKMYDTIKTASMMFSIGCPAACTFCSAEGLRDHTWRSRSPENIVREIEYLRKEFGIGIIETHSDDAFGAAPQAISTYTDLANRLISSNQNINWRSILRATNFRPKGELANEDFWKLLNKSGLERVYIGFEAGTDKRLKELHKPSTIEGNKRAFHFLRNQGIAVPYGFIMFFPDSTLEEIEKNRHFLHDLRNNLYSRYSSSLAILPGSRYFEKYKEQGKLKRPAYFPQTYEFLDPRVKSLYDAYFRFGSEQRRMDVLSLDLEHALVWGNDQITHLGRVLDVDESFLERRANDLHQTGKNSLSNPENALIILSEFNLRWQSEYNDYLTKNERSTT